MNTQIFENHKAFTERENKSVNGVSPEFAAENPEWDIESENKGCWNCSHCSRCYGCYGCYGCSHCSHCSDCSHCSRCYGCYGCSLCSRCSRCSDCSGDKKTTNSHPIIDSIHSKILEAVSIEGALSMADWHTCETTHCRAGWVVHLAGEAGKALEKETSTAFAAMMIYKASSKITVPPTRFYDTAEKALADIKRCAELEAVTK